MDENTKRNLLDFLEAMTQAFHYIEQGCDYFAVKVGNVEVKMDATRKRDDNE